MVKEKKKLWLIAAFILFFVVYFFIAGRPIPRETVLEGSWLGSLDSGDIFWVNVSDSASEFAYNEASTDSFNTIPFILGGRFGYIDTNGRFTINRIKQGNLSLSGAKWAEYDAAPIGLEIKNNRNELIETIDKPHGYPMFLDGRTFIINSEQNALSETNGSGAVMWNYEFSAPLTCADAASGLVLAGSLDGRAEVLDAKGRQLFAFEPGGSRYSVILGCAFSRDGTRFALISGIDKQRFLLFEHFGSQSGEYKIIYHEFLGEGFRQPVHISFVDRDRRVVFELEHGLGIYEINSRKRYTIALEGEVAAIDDLGSEGNLFVITGIPLSEHKKLVGINLPDKIFMNAPFKSSDIFLGRNGSHIFVGGGSNIACFKLEKK